MSAPIVRTRDAASEHDRAARLLELIARFRRRARLRLLVRYAAAGCALALVAGSLLLLFVNRPIGLSVLLWLPAAASGVAALGAAAAWWRCPSTQDVAVALDRRLGLDDSVVAALQVRDGDSPVAPLIVAHALGRARTARPGDVFPLEIRRPVAAIGAGLAVFALSAVMAGTALRDANRNFTPGPPGDASAGEAFGGRENDGADATERMAAGAPVNEATTAADTATPAGSPALDGRAPVPGAPSSDTRAQALDDAPTRPDRSAGGATGESGAAMTDTNGAGGSRGTSARAGADASDGNSDAGHHGDAAGGGGRGVIAVAQGVGSGGVRGGALLATAGAATAADGSLTRNSRYSAQARRSQDRAAGSDDVPPGLRGYVRRYFAAARAASERP